MYLVFRENSKVFEKNPMDTENTFWLGDTILRLDRILAVQHNTNTENELKPSNYVYVTLDNAVCF